MIYIAHRGLLNGPARWENSPWVIEEAITVCGNAEIDVWLHENEFWSGHDIPTYRLKEKWLHENSSNLWIHCKNVQAVEFFNKFHNLWHYFWHEKDTLTMTSKGFLWVYPGRQPVRNSIAVMPELFNDDISECIGICTDYVLKYRGDLK